MVLVEQKPLDVLGEEVGGSDTQRRVAVTAAACVGSVLHLLGQPQ